jgi:hypothetical protein
MTSVDGDTPVDDVEAPDVDEVDDVDEVEADGAFWDVARTNPPTTRTMTTTTITTDTTLLMPRRLSLQLSKRGTSNYLSRLSYSI